MLFLLYNTDASVWPVATFNENAFIHCTKHIPHNIINRS